jgi:ribokinase
MQAKPRITVVGSFNTDLVVRTPRMPIGGETILGGPYFTGPGGKGANQAVAAARLGADVKMVVKVGQDYYGDLACINLSNEGIDMRGVIRSSESHTGVAFIIVDDSGENMIVVASGTNMLLFPADLDNVRDAVLQSDILVLQLEIPMESVVYAARLAHEAGIPVLLNPAPGQSLDDDFLHMVDYLTPNETEAQLITGVRVDGAQDAERAAKILLERGVRQVVVTLGAKGALLCTPEGSQHVPGRKVVPVDTTGAGDCFNGALAVALAEGKNLVSAIEFANCAAALQVTRMGTAPAMPHRDEVEKMLAGNG